MNVLVLNMGMKSIRSIIFNENGCKLSSSARTLSTAINEERVEQEPVEWWEKAQIVISQTIKDAMINHVDFITVTTSASCLVSVDKDLNPIGPCIMVSDKRAKEEVKKIKSMPSYKDAAKVSGVEESVSLLLPKILWLKNHESESFHKIAYFLTPNDFLIAKLCGAIVTDYLNATKFHYDITSKNYPSKLLEELEIDENKLPSVSNTGEYVGNLYTSLSKLFGIKGETKVIVTSYDAICSFIGSGVSKEGDASDVSGTVTVFRALTNKKITIPSARVYSIPFTQSNYNIIGGSNNMGGGLIEWVKQCYYMKEEYPYEVMEKEASESELGARGIIFLPYLLGERAPLWNENARGMFFGLERMHTRKDMTRAVFESSAFIDRSIEEAIGETGVTVSSVRLSGGLARINLVSKIKADVLGKDIHVLSEFETTASGAAMMVFQGQNVVESFDELSNRFSSVRMIIKPNMENHRKYEELYGFFKETYRINKSLFDKRIDVLKNIRSSQETQLENL